MKKIFRYILAGVTILTFMAAAMYFMEYSENVLNKSSYRIFLNGAPAFLTDHFPEKAPENEYSDLTKSMSIKEGRMIYRLILFDLPAEDIIKEQERIEKMSIGKYRADDRNLVTIKALSSMETGFGRRKIYYESLKVNENYYYPIPDFKSSIMGKTPEFKASHTASGLTDDFTLYVLDAKPGIYWKGLDKPVDYMPEGWKNGYSKGVAINQKEKATIYWFVVW